MKNFAAITLCLGLISAASAQDAPAPQTQDPQSQTTPAAAPAPPAAPTALPTPAVTGPLSNLPPAMLDAGPFGKIAVNGIVSGMGLLQNNHVPGDNTAQATLSNGQIFIQKTDGWFQFFIQAGAYDIPVLGVPYLSAAKTIDALYGPLPVAFLKLQAGKNTSILIGALPTLIGAESTFTFQNMNVERGLLWNQENAVNRGIQINQTMGKFTASASWNDGFYSNRYSWVTGSLGYTNGPHALSFVAGGNLGQTKFQTTAVPVQNNGDIVNVIYTYTKGPWIIQPYYQYTNVPTNKAIGIPQGATTNGGAILASYAFKHGFSLPLRWEYITSSGNAANNAVNLLYGPGSDGLSLTATPTYQAGGFFVRGDLSWAHAGNITPGDAFAQNGLAKNQIRAMAEIGFIFGNNITEKK